VLLQSVHSPNAMTEFMHQYSAVYPNATMAEACADASRCEKVVAPFLISGGSLKSQVRWLAVIGQRILPRR
jgi:hypothetical protein